MIVEEEVELGLELVFVAVGDVVRRLVDIFAIQTVAPVQIGQLGGDLEVDVVGLLGAFLELDVEIAGAGQEPGIDFVRESSSGSPSWSAVSAAPVCPAANA